MNQLYTSVLALAATGSVVFANTGSEEWTALDKEIEKLAASGYQGGEGAIDIGALIRAYYAFADSDLSEALLGTDDDDIGGFILQDVDLWFEGAIDDFGWRVSFDLDNDQEEDLFDTPGDGFGGQLVEDAYIDWNLDDLLTVTVGRFKPPVLHSSSIDPEHTLLATRSIPGQVFDFWDEGAMVSYQTGAFNAYGSIMNGRSSIINQHSYMLRLEAAIGDAYDRFGGQWARVNGNRWTEDATVVGVTYFEDDAGSDISMYGVDAASHFDPFWVEIEVLRVESISGIDNFMVPVSNPFFQGLGLEEDSNPWTVTGQMTLSEQFDVALRYQNLDDRFDTSVITVGLDFYPGAPTAKFSLELDSFDGDDDNGTPAPDGTAFRILASLGTSRPGGTGR